MQSGAIAVKLVLLLALVPAKFLLHTEMHGSSELTLLVHTHQVIEDGRLRRHLHKRGELIYTCLNHVVSSAYSNLYSAHPASGVEDVNVWFM